MVTPVRHSRHAILGIVVFAVGCNALVGIDEATVRQPDASAPADGAPPIDATADTAADTDAPGTEAGIDASVEAGTDAAPDTRVDTGLDASAETGTDAGVDAGPITCTLSGPHAVSVGTPQYGPTLAYASGAPPLWGLAWVNGTEIQYNSVDSAGNVQNPAADATPVPTTANTTIASLPRLAPLAANLVLTWGAKVGAGTAPTYPLVQVIAPTTGVTIGGAASGVSVNDSVPVAVGGVAVDTAGDAIATSSRQGSLASQTAARANLFSATPTATISSSPSSTTYATSIGWAVTAARFGMAYVVDGTAGGGVVTTYDSTLAFKTTFPFTTGPDAPAVGNIFYEAAIAGAGNDFAAVWVDQRSGSETEIWLTIIDATTGSRLASPTEVQVSTTSSLSKYYPRVAFDGQSIVVAWVEAVSGTTYDVMWRRFDTSLVPRDVPACVSCGVGLTAPLTGIGLAAGTTNEYGFAFMLVSASNKQYFTHMQCTGP